MWEVVSPGTKARLHHTLLLAIYFLAGWLGLAGTGLGATASLPKMSMSLAPGLIHPNGQLYLWGFNFGGQLGINDLEDYAHIPQRVPLPNGETGWKQVAEGTGFTLGIANSGKLYAWGLNSGGPTGLGSDTGSQLTPAQISQPAGTTAWLAVAAGEVHSLGLANDGELYTWGDNSMGQLGIGGIGGSQSLPVKVTRPEGVTQWTAIAAGGYFSAALANDGILYLWGQDLYDDPEVFGIGKHESPHAAAFPEGVTAWTAISTGMLHIMAVGNNGQLYAWGNNSDGQLARPIESPYNYAEPLMIPLPDGVAGWGQISCGTWHCLALTTTGELYSWGKNSGGRLGLGHTNNVITPTLVEGLPPGVQWEEISASSIINLGLTSDGKCYVWGDGRYGGIGNAALDDKWSPIRMQGFGDLHSATAKNPIVLYNPSKRTDGYSEFYVTCVDPGEFYIYSSTTFTTWTYRGNSTFLRGLRIVVDNAQPAPAKIFWRAYRVP